MELGPRPDVSRGPPLDRWKEFLDPEGRVKNPERIKELVFRGVRLKTQLVFNLLTATHVISHHSFVRRRASHPP